MRYALPLTLALFACAPDDDPTRLAGFDPFSVEVESGIDAPPAELDIELPTLGFIGEEATFSVTGGVGMNERVYLAYGTAEGSGPCFRFLGDHCLTVLEPRLLGTANAEDGIQADIIAEIPASLSDGDTIYLLATLIRGFRGADSVFSDPVPYTVEARNEGCTDAAADNYDSDANVDDGSCTYPPTGTETHPGTACWSILDAGDSEGDGRYWIDPDGDGGTAAFEVYCDMTTDGGGWTLVDNDATDAATFGSRLSGANPDITVTRGSYLPAYTWSGAPQLLCKSNVYTGSEPWLTLNAGGTYALEYPTHTSRTGPHEGGWTVGTLNGNSNQGVSSWIYNGSSRFGSVWIGNGGNSTCSCNYTGANSGLGTYTASSASTCSTWVR